MTAIVTNKFRIQNARAFMNSTDNYYMFIGRPQPWADEISPDNPSDNVDSESSIWDDMMSLKKITSSNMAHGIAKKTWLSGKYYDIYRHDYGQAGVTGVNIDNGSSVPVTNISEANYYVVTSEGNIYICLGNNNNSTSTQSPDNGTIDGSYIVTCSDGYIWRKIAVTSGSDVVNFVTPQYYPVKTLESDPGISSAYYTQWLMQEQAKIDYGMLTNIKIVNPGSGYGTSQVGLTSIEIIGDGTGATATYNTGSSGEVTAITITSRGSGYTWANVVFTGTGSSATAKAIVAPFNGLGADPVVDLCAYNTILNVRFEYAEGGSFTTSNDYRRIGLLVNPLEVGGSALFTGTTGEASVVLKVSSVTGTFTTDQVIKSTGAGDQPHARIIDVIEGTGADAGLTLIRIIRTREENSLVGADGYADFNISDTIEVVTGGTAAGTIDEIVSPDIRIGSGKITYIENRRQITRNPDQIESITTVFEW